MQSKILAQDPRLQDFFYKVKIEDLQVEKNSVLLKLV